MSAAWSRPRLQRQELGPMLHDLGHVLYDQAEEAILRDGIQPEPVDLETLVKFGSECVDTVLKIAEYTTHQAIVKTQALLDDTSHIEDVDEGLSQLIRVTHLSGARDVLNEGLMSGVVIPLQLYRTMRLAEDGAGEHTAISAVDAADRITSPSFQTMLHQLAVGNNGSLGVGAASATYLGSPRESGSLRVFREMGPQQAIFEFDDVGKAEAFTTTFLAIKKEIRRRETQGASLSWQTGGCPVRHTDFPVLGEHAQNYFDAIGQDGPRNQGESLITRASRFVSAALLKSTEGAQA